MENGGTDGKERGRGKMKADAKKCKINKMRAGIKMSGEMVGDNLGSGGKTYERKGRR